MNIQSSEKSQPLINQLLKLSSVLLLIHGIKDRITEIKQHIQFL